MKGEGKKDEDKKKIGGEIKKMKSKKTVAIGIALALTITMLTSIGVASAIPFIDFDGTIWSACAYSGTLPPFCGVEAVHRFLIR